MAAATAQHSEDLEKIKVAVSAGHHSDLAKLQLSEDVLQIYAQKFEHRGKRRYKEMGEETSVYGRHTANRKSSSISGEFGYGFLEIAGKTENCIIIVINDAPKYDTFSLQHRRPEQYTRYVIYIRDTPPTP